MFYSNSFSVPLQQGLFGTVGVNMVLEYLVCNRARVACVQEWEMLLAGAIECVWCVTLDGECSWGVRGGSKVFHGSAF